MLQRTGARSILDSRGFEVRKPIEERLTWDFMYANNTALLAEGIASLKAAFQLL